MNDVDDDDDDINIVASYSVIILSCDSPNSQC